jgi:hypothetical protein
MLTSDEICVIKTTRIPLNCGGGGWAGDPDATCSKARVRQESTGQLTCESVNTWPSAEGVTGVESLAKEVVHSVPSLTARACLRADWRPPFETRAAARL